MAQTSSILLSAADRECFSPLRRTVIASGSGTLTVFSRTGCAPYQRSSDPTFAENAEDIVALYMSPPARAVVLSIDEKSDIQALIRTRPGTRVKPSRPATMTHDYERNGTTTLFAALDVLEDTVPGRCVQHHRHQEFIRFLNAVEASVPVGKVIHTVLNNYAVHNYSRVRAWLWRHPRWVLHFTPTSASWMNAVEGLFAALTRRRLRRGDLRSLVDLQAAIHRYIAEHNDGPRPFTWTKPASAISTASTATLNQANEAVH